MRNNVLKHIAAGVLVAVAVTGNISAGIQAGSLSAGNDLLAGAEEESETDCEPADPVSVDDSSSGSDGSDSQTYTAPTIYSENGIKVVRITWDAVEGAERYAVVAFEDDKWRFVAKTEDTSYDLDRLIAGKEYKIAVITLIGGKWYEDHSNAINVTPDAAASPYPTVTGIDFSEENDRFRLNWSAIEGSERYGIAVDLDGRWKVVTQSIPEDRTYFDSPKFKEAQTYKLVICAKIDGKWDVRDLNSRTFEVTVEPEPAPVVHNYEAEDFQFSGNVYVIGDSSICTYDYSKEHIRKRGVFGWGMMLANEFNGVKIINLGRGGASARNYVKMYSYRVLRQSIGKGDYLFIQFGHNDEKVDETRYPGYGTYPGLDFSTLDDEGKNADGQYSFEWLLLNLYIRGAKARGATVVLVTPITRRYGDDFPDKVGMPRYEEHEKYAAAIIALGKQYNIPVIDLTAKTVAYYNELYNEGGAAATASLHCKNLNLNGIDNSHLNAKGATIIADMAAKETKTLNLKIAERLRED
ncbi:Lysophospholipase L1 [Ruminococcus sp. YE71]|uniref:GDSL-type esterase/lipase family protein n=1 Tax=unclassified Ruminococcus TaxID=2608920 RepID=UPI0008874038|nr:MULTISPECIES: GDSL-type esterase/lipase family protein [unclassified Ruminococcus]SDA28104.1 Lysophospholipase L1 [Ruminococcus sp. YE78]SFW35414.1 Lysophospholipase L1 [Ruminococcus sp. YE71]